MNRTILALSTLMFLTAPAFAEDYPSYESRGYGGPLYVGPNFNSNNSAPSYKPSKPVYRDEPRRQAPVRKRTNTVKAAPADNAKTQDQAKHAAPAAEKEGAEGRAQNENSGISRGAAAKAESAADTNAKSAAVDDNENSSIAVSDASVKNATAAGGDAKDAARSPTTQTGGCKKYFPAAGVTLTVTCE